MKKREKRRLMKKHGYDYAVLIKVWELEEVDKEEDEADELEIKTLQDYLQTTLSNQNHTLKTVAKDLRFFLKQLSKYDHTYFKGVWKAMSKIKDDFSLVQITIPIIGYMWD